MDSRTTDHRSVTAQQTEHRTPADPVVAAPGAEHVLLRLQRTAGNAAVSRMIQRVAVGTHKVGRESKTWEAMGGFSTKHMLEDALTPESARAKWSERYKKDPKGWHNTVVAKADLSAAVEAGKVKGTYPAPRTKQRVPLVVEVAALKVSGRTRDGQKVPGAVTELTKIGVAGSATEGLYYPDHLEGSLSG
jgi:hypothetical protein